MKVASSDKRWVAKLVALKAVKMAVPTVAWTVGWTADGTAGVMVVSLVASWAGKKGGMRVAC